MKLLTRSVARLWMLVGLLMLSASSFAQSCAAGSYCGTCPAGSYSAAGAAFCTQCAAGTFSGPGSATCTSLSAQNYLTGGSIITGTGFSGQAACPATLARSDSRSINSSGTNTVALGNFNGTNYPIAAGTTCIGNTTYALCNAPGCNPPPACLAGTFMVSINNIQYCAAAPKGSYSNGSSGVYMCPSGKTTTGLGSTSASACQ